MHETLIDLMRHGEPVGGRCYRGQTDDPLSDKGWRQMWDAVGDFRGWQRIITSPLIRCSAFADMLGEKLDIPVTRDERLKEMGFGEWEGRAPSDIQKDDPQRLFRFKLDPVANAPAGAEPLQGFYERVGAAWQHLATDYRGGHLLVVGHAGMMRMMIAHALGLPYENVYRINVGNAALSRIRVEWSEGRMMPSLVFHDGKL
jgi:alpha-ribazole phosphatase/probable phosphoglycerate mutase